mgnify:CR=1 FL=1
MVDLQHFVKKIASIKERRLRSFIVAEKILELEEQSLLSLLDDIVKFSFRGDVNTIGVLFSLVDVLEGIFDKEISQKVMAKLNSVKTSNITLKHLINPPPSHRFLKKGEIEITDVKMDYIPLGVKRSLAKKMDILLLRRMVFEKDPIVIKHLLSNPLITEKDVLKISSIRPTTHGVIKTIYSSDKWINYYAVKEAIIKNPYTPFRIALVLLFYMQKQELESIKKDETLHPEIRYEANKMIIIRKS